MLHRFSRTELLIGKQGLAVLAGAKVAVFGIGGVGSFAAEALARSGIGSLTLVDFDRIELTNINRQLHALHSTVGMYKVDVMQARIQDINPDCRVDVRREFFQPERDEDFLNPGFDYVIDAIDSIKRLAISGAPSIYYLCHGCRQEGPCLQVVISETCNFARGGLRDLGITKGVKVVFSPELPQGPREEMGDADGKASSQGRQPPGSIAFVPPAAGLIAAGAVVRGLLAGGLDHGDRR